MWQVYFVQAHQIAKDRVREADRERLARQASAATIVERSRFGGLRRGGAIVAAGIARRLDECVAREELGLRTSDERLGSPG
jgi:hypothetical protein